MAVAVPDQLLHAAQDLQLAGSARPDGKFTMDDIERIAAIARIQPVELVELAIMLKTEGVTGDGTVFVPVCRWLERNYHIVETGEPIVLFPFQKAILDYIFPFQVWDVDAAFWTQIVYSTIKKSGKSLSLDTKLPTPSGWTTMGDVTVGDELLDEQGKRCRVTYMTEIMYGHTCYKVRFSDGNVIVADAEHLWTVDSLTSRPGYTSQTITTEQIRATLTRNDGARNHRISVCEPLDLPDVELPIEPYVLGVWLGDGSSSKGEITCCDAEILERVALDESVRQVALTDSSKAPQYLIGSRVKSVENWHWSRTDSLKARLRAMDLLNNKHIPNMYLRAGLQQRWNLMQGLMDTDGTITKARGTSGCECSFEVTSAPLAYGFCELAATLGIKTTVVVDEAKLYGKPCGMRYRVKFHAAAHQPVFFLQRKRDRQREATGRTARSTSRHIIAVEPVESVPVRCVQVDSPSHLYLAGDGFIATHNTALTGGVARWVAEQWKPWPLVLTGANDLTQARTRIYQQVLTSLEMMPGWDPKRRHVLDSAGNMLWNVTEEKLLYAPNHGTMLALSSDFRGEAGANPTATFFSELWGFTLDKLKKLWQEMVPVATRVGSFRWAETYAGYKNEKGPLNDLYDDAVRNGEQLNCHTMPNWPTPLVDCNCYNTHGCCPEHDTSDNRFEGFGYPMYVNRKSNLVAYWDMGLRARRLPWQNEIYYSIQRELFKKDPAGYERLHENRWTESVDAYCPISWWDNNEDQDLIDALELRPGTYGLTDKEPIVLGLDAAVSSDCCAVSLVSRHPKRKSEASLRACWIWYPPTGGVFNYQDTIERKVRQLCGCFFDYRDPEKGHSICNHRRVFNIVNISYDAYQLHDVIQRLQRDGLAWCYDFSQGAERGSADKQLLDSIRDRSFAHPGARLLVDDGFGPPDGLVTFREHLEGADKKTATDDNTKCRIIKRNDETKIDGPVATSMAGFTCKRLNLE